MTRAPGKSFTSRSLVLDQPIPRHIGTYSRTSVPQDRSYTGAFVTVLDNLLTEESLRADVVTFLQR